MNLKSAFDIDKLAEFRKEKCTQPEYYRIIMGQEYFDCSTYSIDSISIDSIPSFREEIQYGFFGHLKEVQVRCTKSKKVGIYAIKDESGIHEMITGKEVTMYGLPGDLYCMGLCEVSERDIGIMVDDLKFINSSIGYSREYADKLLDLSEKLYNKQLANKNAKQEKEDAFQYIKNYKVPRI